MEQVQLSYQPVQDRLVFILNQNDEKDHIWFTRRFTKILLEYLDKFVNSDPLVSEQITEQKKQELRSFQSEAANHSGQINKMKIDKQALPTDQQVLATAIAIDDQRVIRIRCSNDKTLNLNINTQMAYMLKNLLLTTLQQTDWGLTEVTNKKPNKPVSVHYKASLTVN